jgi:hypothetical protein
MNSHQDDQDAPCRERNLTVNGSNNAPHQEVQSLQKMSLSKMIKLHKMNHHQVTNRSKRPHQHMLTMTPWVKR